jgi:hypothetical protein
MRAGPQPAAPKQGVAVERPAIRRHRPSQPAPGGGASIGRPPGGRHGCAGPTACARAEPRRCPLHPSTVCAVRPSPRVRRGLPRRAKADPWVSGCPPDSCACSGRDSAAPTCRPRESAWSGEVSHAGLLPRSSGEQSNHTRLEWGDGESCGAVRGETPRLAMTEAAASARHSGPPHRSAPPTAACAAGPLPPTNARPTHLILYQETHPFNGAHLVGRLTAPPASRWAKPGWHGARRGVPGLGCRDGSDAAAAHHQRRPHPAHRARRRRTPSRYGWAWRRAVAERKRRARHVLPLPGVGGPGRAARRRRPAPPPNPPPRPPNLHANRQRGFPAFPAAYFCTRVPNEPRARSQEDEGLAARRLRARQRSRRRVPWREGGATRCGARILAGRGQGSAPGVSTARGEERGEGGGSLGGGGTGRVCAGPGLGIDHRSRARRPPPGARPACAAAGGADPRGGKVRKEQGGVLFFENFRASNRPGRLDQGVEPLDWAGTRVGLRAAGSDRAGRTQPATGSVGPGARQRALRPRRRGTAFGLAPRLHDHTSPVGR